MMDMFLDILLKAAILYLIVRYIYHDMFLIPTLQGENERLLKWKEKNRKRISRWADATTGPDPRRCVDANIRTVAAIHEAGGE